MFQANVINVMPPGKKRRRRRRRSIRGVRDGVRDKICVHSPESSLSGEMSLATMFLVQSLLTSSPGPGPGLTCQALSDLNSLGLGGRILSAAVRSAVSLTNITDLHCGHHTGHHSGQHGGDHSGQHGGDHSGHHGTDHGGDHSGDHEIKCSQCGHTLGRGADIINLQSDHSVSTGHLTNSPSLSTV